MILKYRLNSLKISNEIDIEQIVDRLLINNRKLTGADIDSLCNHTIMITIREIVNSNLSDADLNVVKQENFYQAIEISIQD